MFYNSVTCYVGEENSQPLLYFGKFVNTNTDLSLYDT